MLELFVFLSGYVYGYQQIVKGKTFSFASVVKTKFKHLIIPSIIFSVIYFVCFNLSEFNWLKTPYAILNGCGHMWFLPMLFWCFILIGPFIKLQINGSLKFIILLFLGVCSFLPLPLQLNSTCYYLLFFYCGFYVMTHKEKLLTRFNNLKIAILLVVLFVLTFVPLTLLQRYMCAVTEFELIQKILYLTTTLYCRTTYAIIGVLMVYILANFILKSGISVPRWIILANAICFAVYIFQQFILKFLYYSTSLSTCVGPYWLPFTGLIITLSGSIIMGIILQKTKIGKFLFG